MKLYGMSACLHRLNINDTLFVTPLWTGYGRVSPWAMKRALERLPYAIHLQDPPIRYQLLVHNFLWRPAQCQSLWDCQHDCCRCVSNLYRSTLFFAPRRQPIDRWQQSGFVGNEKWMFQMILQFHTAQYPGVLQGSGQYLGNISWFQSIVTADRSTSISTAYQSFTPGSTKVYASKYLPIWHVLNGPL